MRNNYQGEPAVQLACNLSDPLLSLMEEGQNIPYEGTERTAASITEPSIFWAVTESDGIGLLLDIAHLA